MGTKSLPFKYFQFIYFSKKSSLVYDWPEFCFTSLFTIPVQVYQPDKKILSIFWNGFPNTKLLYSVYFLIDVFTFNMINWWQANVQLLRKFGSFTWIRFIIRRYDKGSFSKIYLWYNGFHFITTHGRVVARKRKKNLRCHNIFIVVQTH